MAAFSWPASYAWLSNGIMAWLYQSVAYYSYQYQYCVAEMAHALKI